MKNNEPSLFDQGQFDSDASAAAERVIDSGVNPEEAWDGAKYHRDYRATPSVEDMRGDPEVAALMAAHERPPSTDEFRRQKLAEARQGIQGESIDLYAPNPPKPPRPLPGSRKPAA